MKCYRCQREMEPLEYVCYECGAMRLRELSAEAEPVFMKMVRDLHSLKLFLEYHVELEAQREKEPLWMSEEYWRKQLHVVEQFLERVCSMMVIPPDAWDAPTVYFLEEQMRESGKGLHEALMDPKRAQRVSTFTERLPKMKFYVGDPNVLKRSVHLWDKEAVQCNREVLSKYADLEELYLDILEYCERLKRVIDPEDKHDI